MSNVTPTWGHEIHSYRGDRDVHSIAFTPDGRHIVSMMGQGTIQLWDFAERQADEEGRQVQRIDIRFGAHAAVAISPDGRLVMCGLIGSRTQTFNLFTGELVHSQQLVPGKRAHISFLAFSPDGQYAAVGLRTSQTTRGPLECGPIQMWRVTDPEQVIELMSGEDLGEVTSIVFSTDGRYLMAGASAGAYRIYIWDIVTRELVQRLAPNDSEVDWRVTLSVDARTFAFTWWGDQLRIGDIRIGEELQCEIDHGPNCACVAFSPDGRHIACGSDEGVIEVCNTMTGERVRHFQADDYMICSMTFSPDGQYLISGSDVGWIRVWDVWKEGRDEGRTKHYGRISVMLMSPRGHFVLTGGEDGRVNIWDTATGDRVQHFAGHRSIVFSAAWSIDGLQIVSGARSLRLSDVMTGAELQHIVVPDSQIVALAISPDKSLIASESTSGSVQIWNAANGNEVRAILPDTFDVRAMSFSPDGSLLAVGCSDDSIYVWDMVEDRQMTCVVRPAYAQPSGALNFDHQRTHITFSSDKKWIAMWSHEHLAVVSLIGPHAQRSDLATPGSRFLSAFFSGGVLSTNAGDIDIGAVRDGSRLMFTPSAGGTIVTNDRVRHGGREVLRLDKEYRRSTIAHQGDILVLGSPSGLVTVFILSKLT